MGLEATLLLGEAGECMLALTSLMATITIVSFGIMLEPTLEKYEAINSGLEESCQIPNATLWDRVKLEVMRLDYTYIHPFFRKGSKEKKSPVNFPENNKEGINDEEDESFEKSYIVIN